MSTEYRFYFETTWGESGRFVCSACVLGQWGNLQIVPVDCWPDRCGDCGGLASDMLAANESAAAAAWPAVGAAAVAAVREEAAAAYNSVPLSVDEARRDLAAWAVISTRSAERLAAAVVADREAFEALVANGGVRAESRLFAAAAAAIDELANARVVAAADMESLVKARAALEAAELAAPYPPVSTAPAPSAAERAAVRAAAAAMSAKRAAAGFSL